MPQLQGMRTGKQPDDERPKCRPAQQLNKLGVQTVFNLLRLIVQTVPQERALIHRAKSVCLALYSIGEGMR